MCVTLGNQFSETMGRWRLPTGHHVMLAERGALVVSLLVSSHWKFLLIMNALVALQSNRDRVDALLIDLLDAETGVCGHAVAGNASYREARRKAVPDIGHPMPDLREDSRDDAALTNVRKHALTKFVRIDRSLQDGTVRLEAEDDGRGCDPAAVCCTHGIAGMRFPGQMLRGRLNLHPLPRKGTPHRSSMARALSRRCAGQPRRSR